MPSVLRGEHIIKIGYNDVIDMLEENSSNLSIGMFNNKQFKPIDRFSSFEEFFTLLSRRSIHYYVCEMLRPEVFIVRINDEKYSSYNERIRQKERKENIYKDLKEEEDFHIFNMNATF